MCSSKYLDFGPDAQCVTDADCAARCKKTGACKCHPHGICVVDCLTHDECPDGKYCDFLFKPTSAYPFDYMCCGKCTDIPKDLCGDVCKM